MKTTTYRQGDVYLRRLEDRLPLTAATIERDRGRIVLAYGEVTGHAHAVLEATATLLEDPETGARFLLAPSGAIITHEEHSAIRLPAGTYEVRRQREYSPEAIRRVAD